MRKFKTLIPGRLCHLREVKYALRAKRNFDLVDKKLVGCCIAVQNFRKFARV